MNTGWARTFRVNLPTLLAFFAAILLTGTAQAQQLADRVIGAVDTAQVQPLLNHFPQWANSANDLGAVAPETEIDRFTIVLARSPQQEAAFRQLLDDQQNPSSPNYHRWLTPEQVGERFGLSDGDIAEITGWLQSQGLHVTFVSPSRIFVGFGGRAGDVGRAFQSELHNYKVNSDELVSVSSEPMIPQALSPVIKAVRGLYTIQDKPFHSMNLGTMPSPSDTFHAGSTYFVAPADFATIYDLPSNLTGAGETIGIVGEARTDFADFANFRALTGSTFPNPTEIIPPGGVDPGAAVTTSGSNAPGAQGEAELDVMRSGSVAPGAAIDLVVATSASGGIGLAAQYLVHTTPLPAQVMSISWGGCELGGGQAGVNYWDSLFQIAASEGISVFVASGDSGASGCDPYNAAPPATPQANSPNYICSSSYATCVGGTEFNDASSYSTYWSSTNSSTLGSALSYIPEGAWNEPGTSPNFVASATGGGVSTIIPTPTWQTGTGVPSARAGRYTPDISFTSAGHDGYFGCFAAGGGDCVVSGGTYHFEGFLGTSAAAPDMAGITALLDQKLGTPQGNLNPAIYGLAASTPTAFHDVTVASSGVSGCVVTTPSMCNNSAPSPTALTGGQAGFLVNTGYDEVTGWGSLDVSQFINSFTIGPQAPTVTTGSASAIATTTATLGGTVNPHGADTHVWFLYGTSSTLTGATQTASQDIGSGTAATAVAANITGLTASTTYYFQIVAQNATGTISGAIVSFSTIAVNSPPTTTTNPASAITATTATLAASVNPNGAATNAWFLFGTSNTLAGATQTTSQPIGSGTASTALTANLTGLTANTTYFFQAVAQNANGTTSGSIVSFATPALPTYSISGTAVSVTAGATTGNTSTITVTPQLGFTGTVALACAFSANAPNDPATCSISPASLTNFTGTTAQTSTLTIGTTARTSALNQTRKPFWPTAGGAALALLMLFGIPARRRSWRAMLGMIALLFILAGGVVACGGSSGGGGGGGNSGTTAGFYTITITGTSGSITENSTVSLTVQ
ncbi:MAG: S53 family peptidase [Terracidiphilus sp.]